jgi:hypothetical protein
MEEEFRRQMNKLKREDKDGNMKLDPSNVHFDTVDF